MVRGMNVQWLKNEKSRQNRNVWETNANEINIYRVIISVGCSMFNVHPSVSEKVSERRKSYYFPRIDPQRLEDSWLMAKIAAIANGLTLLTTKYFVVKMTVTHCQIHSNSNAGVNYYYLSKAIFMWLNCAWKQWTIFRAKKGIGNIWPATEIQFLYLEKKKKRKNHCRRLFLEWIKTKSHIFHQSNVIHKQ